MHLTKLLIKLVRHKHIGKIWRIISKILINIGGVRLASYLTYLGIEWGNINKLNPTVLCISRDYFSKDIAELRKRTDINYPSILGGYSRFQKYWFPKKMLIQTFYQNYKGNDKDVAINKSIKYARYILEKVNKVQKVDAIMSANFDYWQDIGFKHVCKKLGIPFLVLSREHVTIPASFELVTKWYKESSYKFNGTAIAVGGDSTAKIFDKCSILNKSDVWVTGLPRLDIWNEIKTDISLKKRPYITLLTFTEGYLADNSFKEIVKLFAIESLKYNNIEFIVKCKNYDDKIAVLKILEHNDTSKLSFVYDIPLYDILPKSRLVINYNSLAIVEAVIARCKVVVPHWGECKQVEKNMMCNPNDPLIKDIISFVNKPEEFSNMIRESFEGKHQILDDKSINNFVNKYFYVPQESTISKKVEEFIKFYIKK